MKTIAEQMRAFERDHVAWIDAQRERTYARQRLATIESQRDASISWARRWRRTYPRGATNNVRCARSLNRESLRIRRHIRALDAHIRTLDAAMGA